MMSSSAEVDSFLFLLGGLGREEEEGLVLSSLSESEENRSTVPRTWLFLIPLDTRSRSRTDRDFRFFRIPLHRGPSISPDDTLNRTLPVRRLSACAQRWMQNDFQTNTCNGRLNNCTPVRDVQLSKVQKRLMLCDFAWSAVHTWDSRRINAYIHKHRNPKSNPVKGCQTGKYPKFQIQPTFKGNKLADHLKCLPTEL